MENKRQQANQELKNIFNFTSVPVNETSPLPNYNNLEYENLEENNGISPTVINNNVSVNLNVNQHSSMTNVNMPGNKDKDCKHYI